MDRANRANRALTDPNLFKRKEVRLARGVSDLMLWPYTSMVSDLVVLSPALRPWPASPDPARWGHVRGGWMAQTYFPPPQGNKQTTQNMAPPRSLAFLKDFCVHRREQDAVRARFAAQKRTLHAAQKSPRRVGRDPILRFLRR